MLLSATAEPSAAWFADQGFVAIQYNDQSTYVKPNEYLLKVDASAVAKVKRNLGHERDLHITQDILPDGLLLLESPQTFAKVKSLLKGHTGFEYVEPNFAIWADSVPNDPSFNLLYGMNNTGQAIQGVAGTPDDDIDAPEAWDISTGSKNVVVGIIDTGIDYNHPDLAANIWTNTGEIAGDSIDNDNNGYIDDIHGYDFVNNDGDPMDDHYHGTHVAGTIGGIGNNGIGVAGVNWNVSMMGLKFLSSSGSGDIANAVKAQHYANVMRDKGVNVVLTSNSWGGGGFSQAMLDEINASATRNILFIAAAGNAASNNDTTANYPSNYDAPNVIAVAATDNKDALASFSNYGLTTVDLGAPGVNTYSTQPGNLYQYLSGTSMATPHVSGVAALAWSVAPGAGYQQIKDALLNGGDSVASLSGKTVTGKRLNALGTLQQLGLLVIGSTPAVNGTVSSAPTQFTINFNSAINQASLQASDLKVNAISANSVSFNQASPAQAVFTFNSTPVTAQGQQTMTMSAGAVTRASDGASLAAWTGTFRYDALALKVNSSSTTSTINSTTIQLDFNEAISAASVGVADLTLSRGSVTAAQALDADSVLYTLSGVTTEGPLTYSLAADAVTDSFGNPGTAYSQTFNVEFASTALPSAWTALTPPGSRGYEKSIAGSIDYAGDTDPFSTTIPAGAKFSVIVVPTAAGLTPTVQVYNSSNTLVGSGTASGAGLPVAVNDPTAAAGTYSIKVTGNGSGAYTLRVVLNDSLETEYTGGATNDTIATAQNIDAALVSPDATVAPNARFLALAGSIEPSGQTPLSNDFESGLGGFTISNGTTGLWHVSTGRGANAGHSPSTSLYYGKGETSAGGGNYDTGAANSGNVTTSSIVLAAGKSYQLDFNYFLQTENSASWDQSQVLISTNGGSSFTQLASYNGVAEGGWKAATPISLSSYAGQTIQLRWLFNTVDGVSNTYEGWYVDDIKVTALGTKDDYYAVTLAAGDQLSVAGDMPSSNLSLSLLDSASTVLATGAAPTNAEQLITYTAPSTGVYYIKASGSAAGNYQLALVRNGDFEAEGNPLATPNALSASKVAVGSIATAGDVDAYSLSLTSGQQITFATGTPLTPNTPLNPVLTIYDSAGTQLATNDNGAADGRNAKLTFTAPSTGTFRVTVTGLAGSGGLATGEYTLGTSSVQVGAPVAWYKLDESSGNSAADASGNGLTASLVNAPTFTAGQNGNALTLNGTTQYATVQNAAALNPTSAITLSAWVKATDWAGNRRILQKGISDNQYRLLAENGVLKFDLKNVGSITAALPTVGVWHLVTGTYDGTKMTLYVDGVAQVSTAKTGAIATTADALVIGAKRTGDANPGNYFKGSLDDVRVYDRALTLAEVQTLAGVSADIQAPTTPGTPIAASKTDTSVNLTWAASSDNVGVSRYDVYRNGTKVGSTATASYIQSALNANTAYTYYVIAYDATGNASSPSGTLSVTTNAANPTPVVNKLVLINADTDTAVLDLIDGMTISKAQYATLANFSVQAITSGTVKSVKFGYQANPSVRIENGAPWSLFGDSGASDFVGSAFNVGSYTVSATPYSATNAAGTVGAIVTIHFTVVA